MICVRDFPRGEVSVKVGVMEFGLMLVLMRPETLALYKSFTYLLTYLRLLVADFVAKSA